jgi:SAM-dependent methyltransferase
MTDSGAVTLRELQDFYEEPAHSRVPESEEVSSVLTLLRSGLPLLAHPATILDLGCGQGELSSSIRSILPTAKVVGVEWSLSGCRHAQARGIPIVQASVDGQNLPFSSQAFNVVIIKEVIEHLVDTDQVLTEARRVLFPGGLLLLSTPNLAAWFNRILLLVGIQPVFSEVSLSGVYGRPGSNPVGHLRLFTKRALVELLAARGFVEIGVHGATFHRTPRGLRWLDRLLSTWSGGASILLAHARKPPLRTNASLSEG